MEEVFIDEKNHNGLHSQDPNQKSFVYQCTYKNQDAIVKIAHGTKQLRNNSLETERWVYQNLVPKILEIVPGRVVQSLASLQYEKKPASWPAIPNGIKWGGKIVHALVLERVAGLTLRQLLETKSKEKGDIQQLLDDVLLQCAAVLDAFQTVGLMHNDLHCGNVLVEELAEPEEWTWNKYEFKSKWKVKIYDFDHASKTPTANDRSVVENTFLTQRRCKELCECNVFTRSFDWWGLLQGVYSDLETSPLVGASKYREKLLQMQSGIGTKELPDPKNKDRDYTGRLVWIARPCTCTAARCSNSKIQKSWLEDLGPPSKYLNAYLNSRVAERKNSKGQEHKPLRKTPSTTCGVVMYNGKSCPRPRGTCQYHR